MNFLFIITDQQRKDHLSCYNEDMVLKTPNIDRIAKEGIKFTNFYCNNPICMPNRSTIFTGLYPSVHGVTTNGRNLPQSTRTFLDILLQSDLYHTASFGKIHLNYFGTSKFKGKKPKSSQEFYPKRLYRKLTKHFPYFGLIETKIISEHGIYAGHPDYYKWVVAKIKLDEILQAEFNIDPNDSDEIILNKFISIYDSMREKTGSLWGKEIIRHDMPEELYSTTYVKEHTINFLKNFAYGKYKKKHFFAFCSFPDPHPPFSPPDRYFNMFQAKEVQLPPTFYDNHENSNPINRKHYKNYLTTEGTDLIFPNLSDLTEFEVKQFIAASYGTEKMIDDAIGNILQTLEDTGLSRNTVVIYTTDHGELGGDHGFFFKGPFLYQGLINIPFLIKVPGCIKNRVCSSLASSIDLPETILELAGFSIPEWMQGKSLVPLLNNPNEKIYDDILIEIDDDFLDIKTRTLITQDWRLTLFENFGDLYNLKEDPYELNNLWNDERYNDIKLELLLRLSRKCVINQESRITRECSY